MTELLKVSTDLLYHDNDPCELTVHRSDHAIGKLVTGQVIRGKIMHRTDNYIFILTDIPDPRGGFHTLPISPLSIIQNDVSFHIELTADEARKRIIEMVDEQRELIKRRFTRELANCDTAENHLLNKYNLTKE